MEIVDFSNVSTTIATPRNEIIVGDFTWYLRGPIQVYIIMVVILVNVTLLIMLSKSEMKPLVTTLLSAIAIADLMTSLILFPRAMFYYLIDPKINRPWCYIMEFTKTLAAMSHSLSIWFTLLLGFFRYLTVCHPTKAAQWCRNLIAYRAIALMIIISVSVFVCDFFIYKIESQDTWNHELNRSETTCEYTCRRWIREKEMIYRNVQDFMRFILIQIIPSAGLLFITTKLIVTIKKADATRKYLTKQITQPTTDSNRTHVLLILVLILFLIVEIPVSVMLCVLIIQTYSQTIIIPPGDSLLIAHASNNTILATCTFNFCIYCAMGRKFRSVIKRCCRHPGSNNRTQ